MTELEEAGMYYVAGARPPNLDQGQLRGLVWWYGSLGFGVPCFRWRPSKA